MEYKSIIKERSSKKYFPDFEEDNSSRRWYQHDIDTIIYSDMFRKMQRKSQLLSIYDPISRSRLIHTFEVVRIAKEISEKLGLDSELTEAIALAHDFGNVAYGKVADKFLKNNTNQLFRHEEVSGLMLKVSASRHIPDKYRDVALEAIKNNPDITHVIKISEFPYELEVYEYNSQIYYICISPEVLDGVVKHGTEELAGTVEGQVVNYADNIAYLIQDISDFEATGIFDDETKKRYGRSLSGVEWKDSNTEFPISDIVGETTSLRTATLIERFVHYNGQRLKNKTYSTVFSSILNQEIPVLKSEEIVSKAIEACWKFKEEFYKKPLITLSNKSSETKMEQLWNILDKNSIFAQRNACYNEFMDFLSTPIFVSFREEKQIVSEKVWKDWCKACFIAHLTCDEIDLIIKSFLERDYSFNLSLPKIR